VQAAGGRGGFLGVQADDFSDGGADAVGADDEVVLGCCAV
jgi:hypothetical protein